MKKILLGACLFLISSGISQARLQSADQITRGIYSISKESWCKSDWKFTGTQISVDDSINTISNMLMEMQGESDISEYKLPENYGELTQANWNYLLFREMCRQIFNQKIQNKSFSDIFLEVLKSYHNGNTDYTPLAQSAYEVLKNSSLGNNIPKEQDAIRDAIIYAKGVNLAYLLELAQTPDEIKDDIQQPPKCEFKENEKYKSYIYTGEFENGIPVGYVKQQHPDGKLQYEGYIKQGEFSTLWHGKGHSYKKNRMVEYTGEFENDHPKAGTKGIYLDKRYNKEYKVDIVKTNTKYEEFLAISDYDTPNSNNSFILCFNSSYEILWKYYGPKQNNLPHGQGKKYNFFDKLEYKGDFKYGEFNGKYTYQWRDGSKYFGEFENGLPKDKSQGTYTYKGKTYNVNIVKENENEFTVISENGNFISCFNNDYEILWEYFGPKKNNLPHGEGTITYANFPGFIHYSKYVGQFENGYPKDKSQGIYIDKDRNQHKLNIVKNNEKYYATELNNKFILRIGKYGEIYSKYEGEINNNLPHGNGTLTYPDGSKYVGQFKNGYPEEGSTGTYIGIDKKELSVKIVYLENQNFMIVSEESNFLRIYDENYKISLEYKGDIKNNIPDGSGTITYADGSKYEGEFQNGWRNGQGIEYYKNGNPKYNGKWENDKYHGYGTYTELNGDKYTGDFQKGWRHGNGTLTYSNGDKYTGMFNYDQFNNDGILTYANGSKYEGQFYNGKFDGDGILTYYYGTKYEGEFKNDKYHGQGTITYADGSKYEGEFKNGNYHGKGISLWPNGDKYDGQFENGLPTLGFNGKLIDKSDNSEYNVKIINLNNKDYYLGLNTENKLILYFYKNSTHHWKYKGDIKDNLPNGQGILTYSNGTKYEGQFEEGWPKINSECKVTQNGKTYEGKLNEYLDLCDKDDKHIYDKFNKPVGLPDTF